MNRQAVTPAQTKSVPLPQGGILQRKCACGQHTHGGECNECRKKKQNLQRRKGNLSEPDSVPPIVQEVLGSPGQPLDLETRAFMEARFGYDFSQVQIHTDAKAEESARAVNALAYTVGFDVVFGARQYLSGTGTRTRLLAHELAHVVQQDRGGASPSPPFQEHALEAAAEQASEAVARGGSVQVSGATAPGLARRPLPQLGSPPDPRTLSDEALAQEIALIRQWLMDNPVSTAESHQLMENLAALEQEAIRRVERGRAVEQIGEHPPRVSSRVGPVEAAAPAVAGVAIALPAAGAAAPAVGGAATASTAGGTTAGATAGGMSLGAILAPVAAFLAVFLYPRQTIVTGAEELRMLEQAGPRLPDLSPVANIIAGAATGTAIIAMASSFEEAIRTVTEAIEEVLKSAPRMRMRCSDEVIRFYQAKEAFSNAITQYRQLGDINLIRARDAFIEAANALLICLGFPPMFR